MANGRQGLVQTLVSLILTLKDPYPHQVLKNQIFNTSLRILGHLLCGSNHIAPELIISHTLREPVVMPLVDVELQPILMSLPELHLLCDLGQRIR